MLDALAQPRIDSPKPDLTRCGSRWAVVQTHPQAERWAVQNLERQGYETYLPLIAVRRRDRVIPSQFRTVHLPAFTSYVFVVPGSHWAPIRSTLGVSRLLMANGHPALIPNTAMAALQGALHAAEAFSAARDQWSAGMACSIAVGPGNAMPAVVTAVHGNTATIAVMFLGALRDMAVPLASLRARDDG